MSESKLFNLSGKVAVITGGAGVLGFAMGVALARTGATVVLGSRSEQRGKDSVKRAAELGVTLFTEVFDPGKSDYVESAFNKIEKEHGPVNVLVNAAGGNKPEATVQPGTSFSSVPPEALTQVLESNIMAGAVIPTQSLFTRVEKSPRETSVIMIGSVSSASALSRVVGYGMAKAAVENLTRWLAVHASRDLKIPLRVNAIVPGFFLTEQNRYLLQTKDGELTSRGNEIIQQTPMGRFGHPDELTGAAVWLASDSSSFATGSIICIDGGFTAWTGV